MRQYHDEQISLIPNSLMRLKVDSNIVEVCQALACNNYVNLIPYFCFDRFYSKSRMEKKIQTSLHGLVSKHEVHLNAPIPLQSKLAAHYKFQSAVLCVDAQTFA